MFRQKYAEITRKRWYDVIYLFLIALFMEGVHVFSVYHWSLPPLRTMGAFTLLLSVYFLANELTHRHRQAFVTAAALGGMLYVLTCEELWGYALLTASAYYLLRAMRRYGAQWKDMMAAGVLLAGSLLVGGIWPLYNFALPFTVVGIIAIRPIIRYKKWSLPIAASLAIALAALPFAFFPDESLAALNHELGAWQHPDHAASMSNVLHWQHLAECLSGALLWLPLGCAAAGYSLRSQRIHGDPAGQVGVWWLILACVLIMLRPNSDPTNQLALLVPFSFCIGAYTNLLSLPKKLHRNDRCLFRSVLAISGCYYSAVCIYRLSTRPVCAPVKWVCIATALLTVLTMVFLVWNRYNKQKLSIRLTESSLIVLAMLAAAVSSLFL